MRETSSRSSTSRESWPTWRSMMPPTCSMRCGSPVAIDRKSTRLNSSHTEIYTLSLHDALPIYARDVQQVVHQPRELADLALDDAAHLLDAMRVAGGHRSEEHTSELQSHRDLHSFPTRRSSDLCARRPAGRPPAARAGRPGAR